MMGDHVTQDEIEQIIAFIKDLERDDIPDNVWEIIMKWWDILYEC